MTALPVAWHSVCVSHVHTLHLAVSHEGGAALITYR